MEWLEGAQIHHLFKGKTQKKPQKSCRKMKSCEEKLKQLGKTWAATAVCTTTVCPWQPP